MRTFVALGAAALGGLLGMGQKRVSHRALCGLVSLAAGALLAVTVTHIIPETLELAGTVRGIGVIILGTAIFAVIGKYVYFMCPACAASATEHSGGYLRLGILLMVTMGIHSAVDGLAITAGSKLMASTGLLILFAVSYHKIPEGMALVSVARLAGYSRGKAFLATILIELTTALGAFIGLIFLSGVSHLWLGMVLGLVAGSFLYTVGFALLKEMFIHEKSSIILYVLAGFVSILLISAILPAAHAH
jgi:ZIP family zinc transporter